LSKTRHYLDGGGSYAPFTLDLLGKKIRAKIDAEA
jgi:hypothetical protein